MNADRHPFRTTPPSRMDRETFLATFGGVYEHSPWIAEHVWDQGLTASHDSAESLQAAMADTIERTGREAQLALLRAHPDLAGRLAVRGELTADSRGEQAGAGLDRCTAEEFAEFQHLNKAYRKRFGFPFILAVRGLGRPEILENFRHRVGRDPEDEFAEALAQVHRIARLRLRAID